MVRGPRRVSEGDIYHVVARGVSHCIIFEDDADRKRFLDELEKHFSVQGAAIYAWCLMDNHYHILVRLELDKLSAAMKNLNSAYALYFNTKHERDGHLFQGRFKSEPIDSDEYFLTALRYVHQNPVKAGLVPTCDYLWSSFRSYLGGGTAIRPELTDRDFALQLLNGVEAFERFHEVVDAGCKCSDIGRNRKLLSDEDAWTAAAAALDGLMLQSIAALPRQDRDEALRRLRDAHLSIRQIERLTGVSRGIVAKC